MVDVFISYPRVERERVELIKSKLEALGFETFFDITGIDGGDTFPDVIDRALKSAKVVLGVWTPRAFKSKWCMIECRVGEMRGVLVPIALERFEELEMPAQFMATNYLDLTDFDGAEPHEGWSRVLRALSRHVGRELTPSVGGGGFVQGTSAATFQAAWRIPGTVWRQRIPGLPEKAAPEMVTLPPGSFRMGSPDEEEGRSEDEGPRHQVEIRYPFAISKCPIAFAEWDAAIASGADLSITDDEGWGRERRPVINVSREDTQAYIAWLNEKLGLTGRADAYRLPAEAEWEYACRARSDTAYSWGDEFDETRVAKVRTEPVGSYPANDFGLHDVHGNVWEWCEDEWHDNYEGAPGDGSAWLEGGAAERRVLRGGSWGILPQSLRSALRGGAIPTYRFCDLGFRIARTLASSP